MSKKSKTASPLVGILMGSDSDWPTMKQSADALAEFDTAIKRGLKVIIVRDQKERSV